MRVVFLAAIVALAACKGDNAVGDSATLPRLATELTEGKPDYTRWERTGKELMPLDGIAEKLDPIWRPVESCQALGHTELANEKEYRFYYLHSYSRSESTSYDLGCAMEEHGFYVSDVAHVQKPVWSDYSNSEEPRLFTFFRVRSEDEAADFAIYHVVGFHFSGNEQLAGCEHEQQYCYYHYNGPFDVINLGNGLYERFPYVRRNRDEYPEDGAPVAMMLGKDSPEMVAFVSGDADGIPFALARRELLREVQRQYPEGTREAMDLNGFVRLSRSGIVIEDVGANLGFAGTDASYVVRLQDTPVCKPTENEAVRQCVLTVETDFFAYNRATGSRQTKIAQIANVAASGRQSGQIEALFVRKEEGWRMVVTDAIARFLSGVDRQNQWVVQTSDGRTLSGAPAVMCIANPEDC